MNHIRVDEDFPENLKGIESIFCRNVNAKTIPYLPDTYKLYCNNNLKITILSEMPNMIELYIALNNIKKIPKMISLRYFNARNNKIRNIFYCENIEVICITSNRFKRLPYFPKIKILSFEDNKIKDISNIPNMIEKYRFDVRTKNKYINMIIKN